VVTTANHFGDSLIRGHMARLEISIGMAEEAVFCYYCSPPDKGPWCPFSSLEADL
jgi:hypothetical protein